MANNKAQEAIIKVQVGKRLACYRKKCGYSQEALAERVEVSSNTIQKIEAGQRLPSIMLTLRLCNALGIGPDLLYQDSLDHLPALNEKTSLAELINKCSASDRQYLESFIRTYLKQREVLRKESIEIYLKNK